MRAVAGQMLKKAMNRARASAHGRLRPQDRGIGTLSVENTGYSFFRRFEEDGDLSVEPAFAPASGAVLA
jgi:hypothetical protein